MQGLLSNGHTHDDPESAYLDKIRGLETLAPAVTVCTVDTVLGLMQNHRRGLTSAAVLTTAAYVFDEIHAYDGAMWNTLLDFLALFPNAPVLLMSASLPPHREAALLDVLGGSREDLFIDGPAEFEALERYEISATKKQADLVEEAIKAARDGKKVLCVANTVARCIDYCDQVLKHRKSPDEFDTRVYHSRFKYEDRVERHREVVDAFQGETHTKGIIAFTTQVAEMSLDLDADVLLTEIAPVPALIQRLGRLNRKVTPKTCRPRSCLVLDLEDKDAAPYKADDLTRARDWLKVVKGAASSQRSLSDAFITIYDGVDDQYMPSPSPLFAVPLHAHRGKLRDAGFTANFVMRSDLGRVFKQRKVQGGELTKLTIPMTLPRWWDFYSWQQIGFTFVIPDRHLDYDPARGGAWMKSAKGGGV